MRLRDCSALLCSWAALHRRILMVPQRGPTLRCSCFSNAIFGSDQCAGPLHPITSSALLSCVQLPCPSGCWISQPTGCPAKVYPRESVDRDTRLVSIGLTSHLRDGS